MTVQTLTNALTAIIVFCAMNYVLLRCEFHLVKDALLMILVGPILGCLVASHDWRKNERRFLEETGSIDAGV